MSVPVHVTPSARVDVRQGEHYFNDRRAQLGTEFVREVFAVFDRVAEMPLGYGEVDDGVRAVGLRRFGYVVYYRTDGTAVEILAVLHGARSPDVWRNRV